MMTLNDDDCLLSHVIMNEVCGFLHHTSMHVHVVSKSLASGSDELSYGTSIMLKCHPLRLFCHLRIHISFH